MTDSFGVRDDQTRKDLNKPEKKEIGTDLPKPIADTVKKN